MKAFAAALVAATEAAPIPAAPIVIAIPLAVAVIVPESELTSVGTCMVRKTAPTPTMTKPAASANAVASVASLIIPSPIPTIAPITPAITSGISAKPSVKRTQLSKRLDVALNIRVGMKNGASATAIARPILPSEMTMIAAAAMSPPMIQTTMEAMLIPISPDSSASLSENSKSASIMASNATFRFGAPVAPISSAPIAPGVFVTMS